jgi:hypothetical protein
MALVVDGGGLVNKSGALGTGQACCCNKCSGPCDEENPCPEGCVCVDGECVTPDCTGVIVGAYSGCQCLHAPENNAPGEDAAIACAQSACDQFWTPEYSQYACPEGYVITDCTLGPPQVDGACGPPFYIVQVSVSCCPEENPLP